MTMDQTRKDSLSFFEASIFKSSHRTIAEQLLGLSIFLLISFALNGMNRHIAFLSSQKEWFLNLVQMPWTLRNWPSTPIWTISSFFWAFSIWTLWRRRSVKQLRLELSAFFAYFVFDSFWNLTFFAGGELLLSLLLSLFFWSSTLLSLVIFWKKERLAGQLVLLPAFWIFYVMGINMTICIINS